MNFGRAIRLVRSTRLLSQKQLAERLKVNASFISHLERNTREPSMETVQALGRELEVPVYLLVFLASDKDDLRGIPPEQAQAFGSELLRIFTRDLPKRKR